MFSFFKKKEPTEPKNNGAAAAYAILSEVLRDALKSGHTYLNAEFWVWVEKTATSDIKNLCAELIENLRKKVLLLEPHEMKNLSLVDLERLATGLFESEMKKGK